ncbi:MAG: hypothetical protein D6692_04160 [Planctomycetota bacterium]|nr:MAG: hypothetical protein D6692_04160 [Planctomycetota bacterium]
MLGVVDRFGGVGFRGFGGFGGFGEGGGGAADGFGVGGRGGLLVGDAVEGFQGAFAAEGGEGVLAPVGDVVEQQRGAAEAFGIGGLREFVERQPVGVADVEDRF